MHALFHPLLFILCTFWTTTAAGLLFPRYANTTNTTAIPAIVAAGPPAVTFMFADSSSLAVVPIVGNPSTRGPDATASASQTSTTPCTESTGLPAGGNATTVDNALTTATTPFQYPQQTAEAEAATGEETTTTTITYVTTASSPAQDAYTPAPTITSTVQETTTVDPTPSSSIRFSYDPIRTSSATLTNAPSTLITIIRQTSVLTLTTTLLPSTSVSTATPPAEPSSSSTTTPTTLSLPRIFSYAPLSTSPAPSEAPPTYPTDAPSPPTVAFSYSPETSSASTPSASNAAPSYPLPTTEEPTDLPSVVIPSAPVPTASSSAVAGIIIIPINPNASAVTTMATTGTPAGATAIVTVPDVTTTVITTVTVIV